MNQLTENEYIQKILSQKSDEENEEYCQIIIELNENTNLDENFITENMSVKHYIKAISSYIVEIPQKHIEAFSKIDGIKAVHKNNNIAAQMDTARKTVKADIVNKFGYTGRGITIAILDTGIFPKDDFLKPRNRIMAFKDFVNSKDEAYDDNMHGTHVAGICAGNGFLSDGKYAGVAPEANIVVLKILDEKGQGNTTSALLGIQWLIDNKERYNIKVANLSIGSADTNSQDPLIKAVDAVWDAGITVVVAAGNNGPENMTVTSPGSSRKVITVGASDDHHQVQIWGDTLVNFSGRGPTSDCIVKPDIIAPGSNIVSVLSSSVTPKESSKIVDENYIRLSGTSMSTPIVAGAVSLLYEKYPDITPNQVKLFIKQCANSLNYPQNQQGWGLLDIEKLLETDYKYIEKESSCYAEQ